MTKHYRGIETQLVHAGERRPRIEGAVCLPIFQSATFEYSGETNYHDLRYIRLNNTPNHEVLHEKLAELERGETALVAASGMAAITTTLLTLLKTGDHLLAQGGLYGGTHSFLAHDLPDFGIECDFIDESQPGTWAAKVRPNTKLVMVEAISNPLVEVGELKAIVDFARSHRLVSIIDNTFATPVNFRPLDLGFDICIHSCTKYLNGHSDIVAGTVIGPRSVIHNITRRLNHLGGSLDPHACFLLHRGLKTLALRVRYQNESALAIARFLESHPSVQKVYYPGLESHPSHARAARFFSGFGGMLSFELKKGLDAAEAFLSRLQIPVVAPSLGGVESLVTRPAATSHSGMSPAERDRQGISAGLVRLSVGIESAGDLIEDFRQALEGV